MLASLSSSLTDQIASHGVYAVFLLMAIDAVFPAASELVMLYAGALATGALGGPGLSPLGIKVGFGLDAFIALAVSGTLGYLVGAVIGWWIGYRGGRPFLDRHGRWLHLSADRLDRAERWFDRWGNLGVLVGRLTPVVRSFVSIPAGVFRLPAGPYTVLTAIGSAIWAFGVGGAGYGLGASYTTFHHDFRYAEYAVVAGILVVAAYLLYRWRKAATVSRRAEDPAR